jgi:hypothetical protein
LEVNVTLPVGFDIEILQALAVSELNSNSYLPQTFQDSSNIFFNNIPQTENILRIKIGFKIKDQTANFMKFETGIFTFETVPRYAEYAQEILDLYEKTYEDLVGIFNVTLQNAEVRFFLPDFNQLLSIGGYVPFVSQKMGEIHINIVFTRAVEGYIEVIALHELVHHFLWRAGISPETLLWFHEGMAQYVSIEMANKIGYKGSEIEKQKLENDITQMKRMIGNNFNFLVGWSMSNPPVNMGSYYVAAYYVVSRLAQNQGGLDYYKEVFEWMNGEKIDGNSALGYYLSLGAGESIVDALNDWGFEIPDLYLYSPLIEKAQAIIEKMNPNLQPYKYLAELLFLEAISNARSESEANMHLYLVIAVLVAKLTPLLMLLTISSTLFFAVLWIMRREKVI